MENEKLWGYSLLVIGLIIIVVSLFSAWNVFSGVNDPPSIFQTKSLTISVPIVPNEPVKDIVVNLDKGIQNVVNMLLWYICMLFVLAVGGKLAGLGIQFLREIKIEVKQ